MEAWLKEGLLCTYSSQSAAFKCTLASHCVGLCISKPLHKRCQLWKNKPESPAAPKTSSLRGFLYRVSFRVDELPLWFHLQLEHRLKRGCVWWNSLSCFFPVLHWRGGEFSIWSLTRRRSPTLKSRAGASMRQGTTFTTGTTIGSCYWMVFIQTCRIHTQCSRMFYSKLNWFFSFFVFLLFFLSL